MVLYSVPQESEPVRTGSSKVGRKKEKHVQLLLNLVLPFEFKFPATYKIVCAGPCWCWWKVVLSCGSVYSDH